MAKGEQIRGKLSAQVTWTLLWKGADVKCSLWAGSRVPGYALSISVSSFSSVCCALGIMAFEFLVALWLNCKKKAGACSCLGRQ